MKAYVYEGQEYGTIHLKTYNGTFHHCIYLGAIELPIIEEKKILKKETYGIRANGDGSLVCAKESIPVWAKNIKITYEVEE
jgi:hypothetical protein